MEEQRHMKERKARKHTETPEGSSRGEDHAAMLEEALTRPGIREVMQVYQGWQRLDRELDPYRATRRRSPIATTSDHANVSQLPEY